MTRIYLYGSMFAGTAQRPAQPYGVWMFPDPGNWNPNNHLIECVMPGYTGQFSSFGPPEGTTWGTSSRGGSYAYGTISNLVFPAPCWLQSSIQQQINVGTGTAFNWNDGVGNTGRAQRVMASDNTTSNGSNGIIPAGYLGGGGGGGGESGTSPGGPGGGAAGPHGAGGNAGTTNPGSADAGNTPAPAAGNGINGTQWDNIHGCGSGGWQGSATVDAFSGGYFGGGSGGTNSLAGRGSGVGGRGLLIITYLPLPKPAGQAQIMA